MYVEDTVVGMPTESAAVTALEELGLTEYEARCYVALARITQGTAKEVSKVADVPRSRVYDTVERLHARGLVDIQQSDPRQFKAVPKEEALDLLRRSYDESIEAADEALDRLTTVDSAEHRGVWAVENKEHVDTRIESLLADAEREVHVLLTSEADEVDYLVAALERVADRGVSVNVEVPTAERESALREKLPDDVSVSVAPGLDETSEVEGKRPVKLLMVDRHSVLASGVEETDLPGVTEETAVWTDGPNHGLATWMQELLEERLPEGRDGPGREADADVPGDGA